MSTMMSEEAKQRLVAENDELQERIKKLGVFIDSDTFKTLPSEDTTDLVWQYYHMTALGTILERRIARHVTKAE